MSWLMRFALVLLVLGIARADIIATAEAGGITQTGGPAASVTYTGANSVAQANAYGSYQDLAAEVRASVGGTNPDASVQAYASIVLYDQFFFSVPAGSGMARMYYATDLSDDVNAGGWTGVLWGAKPGPANCDEPAGCYLEVPFTNGIAVPLDVSVNVGATAIARPQFQTQAASANFYGGTIVLLDTSDNVMFGAGLTYATLTGTQYNVFQSVFTAPVDHPAPVPEPGTWPAIVLAIFAARRKDKK